MAASTSSAREEIVRAFDNDDAILAARLDEDGSDAARNSFRDADVARVNSLGLKIFDGCGAEEIAADFRDHGYRGAAQASGDRLVCAFAAEAEVEFFAEDGFARARKDVIECCEVHIGAAYDRNERLLRHFSSCGSRANYIGSLRRSGKREFWIATLRAGRIRGIVLDRPNRGEYKHGRD